MIYTGHHFTVVSLMVPAMKYLLQTYDGYDWIGDSIYNSSHHLVQDHFRLFELGGDLGLVS